MMMYDDTWVVVPAFNEGVVISSVVSGILEVFPHVVCVDDASSDKSGALALAAGAHALTHPVNLGQGASLQTGFDWVVRETDARWVVTFDADGQHRVSDAAAMVDLARADDLGFVLGSRFLGTRTHMSTARKAVLRTAAAVSRARTGLRVTDAHNGLRVIRRDVVERLSITHNRMAHASQIVEQLAATGAPWREYAATIDYSDYSKAKGQSLINSVNILVDLMMG